MDTKYTTYVHQTAPYTNHTVTFILPPKNEAPTISPFSTAVGCPQFVSSMERNTAERVRRSWKWMLAVVGA